MGTVYGALSAKLELSLKAIVAQTLHQQLRQELAHYCSPLSGGI